MNTYALRHFQRTKCQILRSSQQLLPLYNDLENSIVREIWFAEDSRKVLFNQLQAFRSIKHSTWDRLKRQYSLEIATNATGECCPPTLTLRRQKSRKIWRHLMVPKRIIIKSRTIRWIVVETCRQLEISIINKHPFCCAVTMRTFFSVSAVIDK